MCSLSVYGNIVLFGAIASLAYFSIFYLYILLDFEQWFGFAGILRVLEQSCLVSLFASVLYDIVTALKLSWLHIMLVKIWLNRHDVAVHLYIAHIA